MTINDIMLRDIMEADKKQREREEAAKARQARPGEAIVKWSIVAGGFLAVATLLFLALCCASCTLHRRGVFGGSESQQAERVCDKAN
jgi:hypothetical protein